MYSPQERKSVDSSKLQLERSLSLSLSLLASYNVSALPEIISSVDNMTTEMSRINR
jgi:hypothetical protein